MKKLVSVLLGLCVASLGFAQPSPAVEAPAVEFSTSKRTPEDLRKLLAPVALYPDALVALILPASTNTADLVLAARFLAEDGDPKEIENQPWDESVKSLARYPEVVKWMDENLAWVKALGEAFAAQPADLMNTMQTLRTEAQAAGLLKDTPQQKVVVREAEVCIEPAQDDVIYMPSYDPVILVERRPVYGSWISFGAGFAVGSWLNYDCDWRSHRVVVSSRSAGWNRPDWGWHRHGYSGQVVYQTWAPSRHYWQHVHNQPRRDPWPFPAVRPLHFAETPGGPRRFEDQRRWDRRRDDPRNDQRVWSQPGSTNRAAEWQRSHSDGRRSLGGATDVGAAPNPAIQTPRGNGDRRGGFSRMPNPGAAVTQNGNAIAAPPAPATSAPVAPQPAPAVVSRQPSDRRFARPVDSTGQRYIPHHLNSPPAQSPQPIQSSPESGGGQQAPAQRFGGHTRSAPPPAQASPSQAQPASPAVREFHSARSGPPPTPAPAAAAPAPVQRKDDGRSTTPDNSAPATGQSVREAHRALR